MLPTRKSMLQYYNRSVEHHRRTGKGVSMFHASLWCFEWLQFLYVFHAMFMELMCVMCRHLVHVITNNHRTSCYYFLRLALWLSLHRASHFMAIRKGHAITSTRTTAIPIPNNEKEKTQSTYFDWTQRAFRVYLQTWMFIEMFRYYFCFLALKPNTCNSFARVIAARSFACQFPYIIFTEKYKSMQFIIICSVRLWALD